MTHRCVLISAECCEGLLIALTRPVALLMTRNWKEQIANCSKIVARAGMPCQELRNEVTFLRYFIAGVVNLSRFSEREFIDVQRKSWARVTDNILETNLLLNV